MEVGRVAGETTEKSLQLDFETLLVNSVRSVQRLAPQQLRLELTPEPGLTARVADLAEREINCCSFFSFTLSVGHQQLAIDVSVPPDRVNVLDEMTKQATAVVGSR